MKKDTMTVYEVNFGGNDSGYYTTKKEALEVAKEFKKEYGYTSEIEKLELGEGWTARELVCAILSGQGYVASREKIA